MTKPAIFLDTKAAIDAKETAFKNALPGFEILNVADGQPTDEQLSRVKYAVVWKHQHGILNKLPNLEVIFSLGAGVDHVFTDPDLPDLPIVRFVDADLTGRMVEYVVLQVLMHVRQQRQYDAQQREREWKELPQPCAADFRVGIMGLGELGTACAAGLKPLGFQLNGWSRSPKQVDGVKSYAGDDQLAEFLGRTDILVCLLPFTPATMGILNKDLIDQLATDGPFGAPVLINGGRGGSQVNHDITNALMDGRLHGASLDVFETEPLPPEDILWSFENAIITPHVAATSAPGALAGHVAHQIKRHESGEGLEHIVDPKQGY